MGASRVRIDDPRSAAPCEAGVDPLEDYRDAVPEAEPEQQVEVSAADAVARHFVPLGAPVVVHRGLVAAGTSGVIHFNAPEKAGRYPYLCTFPGHWRLM